MATKNVVEPIWRDITDVVAAAAAELEVGKFFASESFTLYDAMSALELLDPKMDPPDQGLRAVDLNGLLASGALPTAGLSLLAAAQLSIRLMILEVGWCEGTSSAESVFTCLYLHKPVLPLLLAALPALAAPAEPPEGASSGGAAPEESAEAGAAAPQAARAPNGPPPLALRAFAALSVGVVKTMALTREIVLHADIYEVDRNEACSA